MMPLGTEPLTEHRPKRIGILTYHHGINAGAVLQAYAVAQIYKKTFPRAQVEIVDYRPRNTEIRDLKFGFFDKKNPVRQLRQALHYLRVRRFVDQTLPLSKRRLMTNSYERVVSHLKDRYDLLSVGSDEVWKIETTRFARVFPNAYFLADGILSKQVSFAASANSLRFHELSSHQKEWMASRLSGFDLLSVRDDHTLRMLKHLDVDRRVRVFKVPDPTFYLEFDDAFREATKSHLQSLGVDFDKPLIGITFYDKRIPPSFFESLRKEGHQILALSAYHPDADINLLGKIDPFQWAVTFGFFKICFTNLFHGIICCVKNAVPFLCFDYHRSPDYQTKLEGLLADFGLSDWAIDFSGKESGVEDTISDRIPSVLAEDRSELMRQGVTLRKQEIDRYMKWVERLMT